MRVPLISKDFSEAVMPIRRPLPRVAGAVFTVLWPLLWPLLLGSPACGIPDENGLAVPIPLKYQDGLLYAYGDALLERDQRCDVDPGDSPPSPSPSPLLLIELSNPLSVVSDAEGRPPQPFRHGQVQLNASQGWLLGAPRFLLCDVPLLRGNQALSDFFLERRAPGREAVSTGSLGAVLGSDLFSRFAMTFAFTGSPFAPDQGAELTIQRSELKDSCFIDDAVVPFVPVGGDLKVQVGDSIVTYSPSRVTIAACVEPIADPLAYRPSAETVRACIDPTKFTEEQCIAVRDNPELGIIGLGDQVSDKHLRDPGYDRSGVSMRFLLSTSVPDVLLSETACRRLDNGAARCTCNDDQKVTLRLPGINGPQPEPKPEGSLSVERGCPMKLGQPGRAGLALIATQLQLAPCDELARSRRQRWAIESPGVTPPFGVTPPTPCLREACLENLAREASLTADRCAYTGMEVDRACDDHQAPVAAYVEVGGPADEPGLPDDGIEVLVVPDSSRVLQAVNIDLRNTTAQVDGVIGVSLLSRLHTVIDYPQTRVELVCRCGQTPRRICRTYRGVSFHDADACVPNSTVVIPPDFGRAACR
jgi:hypothetical protein